MQDRRAVKRGVRIHEAVYRDKVLGCWLGKNAGGTLGDPVEFKFGQDQRFDLEWYSHLPEGGIPNDDLEMQLIWLQALQDRGPGITSRELADYWLDCVGYNYDEYGLSKANLQKGLPPPVSGWNNNWFKNGMGSPIRSEIWACVAPGSPEVAARYAFEDAIIDHGGGESVYGEVFNAVVESCAFVLEDKLQLLEIGLGAIPQSSLTYQAIRRAISFFEAGVSWTEARDHIKDEFFVALAGYEPINMGFQTIGLLYGSDFGDALCKTVNCGWDTDSTGATVGAILGMLMGASRLPERWIAPLGRKVSTNLDNGGIRHLRVPTDLNALTDEIYAMCPRVLRYWDSDTQIIAEREDPLPVDPSPDAPVNFRVDLPELATYNPASIHWSLTTIDASLTYERSAFIRGSEPAKLWLRLKSRRPVELAVHLDFDLPPEWRVEGSIGRNLTLQPFETRELPFSVVAPASAIEDSNQGTILLRVDKRPALERLPLVLLGSYRWLVSRPFAGSTLESECGIDEHRFFAAAPSGWSPRWVDGNDLQAEELFGGEAGVVYLLHQFHSDASHEVRMGVSNSWRMKLWHDGVWKHQTQTVTPLRPNQGNGGGDGANYCETTIHPGWNQVLIKLERGSAPIEAHFTLGLLDPQHPKCVGHTVVGLRRAQFRWEADEQPDTPAERK